MRGLRASTADTEVPRGADRSKVRPAAPRGGRDGGDGMSAMIRSGHGLYTAVVTAQAHLPLPAPPDSGSDEVVQLELLTITAPPRVVAAAMDALADHLEDLLPTIAKLYDTQGG